MARPVYALDDFELDALIKELTPKIKKKTPIAGVTGFISFIFFILTLIERYAHENHWRALGFIIIAFVVGTFASMVGADIARYKKRLKYAISDSVVRCALATRFKVSRYQPKSYIERNTIVGAGLVDNWRTYSGSDLVEGTYKGVRFVFSDVNLVQRSNDDKGNANVSVFKGQWLILELAKPLASGVQLIGRKGNNNAKSDAETENIEFNRRFQIIAPNPLNAFLVLTPQFIEQTLTAVVSANARTSISFTGNQMHIALDSNRDLFEFCEKKSSFAVDNIETMRMQMRWDVNYIANIIDEFIVNETLFEVK
ncbi:MAG: DUF3137 domain-containing protein [Oscillospiraceae bacterium]|nr:DUF3137 domain-containing protein [Oscillospiraceae bacterium]